MLDANNPALVIRRRYLVTTAPASYRPCKPCELLNLVLVSSASGQNTLVFRILIAHANHQMYLQSVIGRCFLPCFDSLHGAMTTFQPYRYETHDGCSNVIYI